MTSNHAHCFEDTEVKKGKKMYFKVIKLTNQNCFFTRINIISVGSYDRVSLWSSGSGLFFNSRNFSGFFQFICIPKMDTYVQKCT